MKRFLQKVIRNFNFLHGNSLQQVKLNTTWFSQVLQEQLFKPKYPWKTCFFLIQYYQKKKNFVPVLTREIQHLKGILFN